MTEQRSSSTVEPGQRLNIVNGGPMAMRVRVVTACCGTETVSTLHPGARLEMTAGTSGLSIYVLDVPENYTGLRLVRPEPA
jgi:hypothetical protein